MPQRGSGQQRLSLSLIEWQLRLPYHIRSVLLASFGGGIATLKNREWASRRRGPLRPILTTVCTRIRNFGCIARETFDDRETVRESAARLDIMRLL